MLEAAHRRGFGAASSVQKRPDDRPPALAGGCLCDSLVLMGVSTCVGTSAGDLLARNGIKRGTPTAGLSAIVGVLMGVRPVSAAGGGDLWTMAALAVAPHGLGVSATS